MWNSGKRWWKMILQSHHSPDNPLYDTSWLSITRSAKEFSMSKKSRLVFGLTRNDRRDLRRRQASF